MTLVLTNIAHERVWNGSRVIKNSEAYEIHMMDHFNCN